MLPPLPSPTKKDFYAEVEVVNSLVGSRHLVRESVEGGDAVVLRMMSADDDVGDGGGVGVGERMCAYSRASGFGHKIRGEYYRGGGEKTG